MAPAENNLGSYVKFMVLFSGFVRATVRELLVLSYAVAICSVVYGWLMLRGETDILLSYPMGGTFHHFCNDKFFPSLVPHVEDSLQRS